MLSIVIPVYNGLSYTKKCLEDLHHTLQSVEHEIVIVDDGSTDGTQEYLRSLKYPVRAFFNTRRAGVAVPCNIGAEEARGDLLCFLNNDMEFAPGWIEPLLQAHQELSNASQSKVGIIGNVHWSPRTGRYDHMGMIIGSDGTPGHFGRYWRFIPFRGYKEWPTIPSACWVMKKKLYLEMGGQSTDYVTGCEDMDLCLRLHQQGYRNYVVYNSVVKHYVSVSPSRHDRTIENERLLLQKWGDYLLKQRTSQMIRLSGLNYLGRFLDRPWHYNGPKLLKAVRELAFGR